MKEGLKTQKATAFDRHTNITIQLKYGRTWHKARKRILSRDHYKCVACDVSVGLSGQVDHIIPVSKGGKDADDNLQTLCIKCHSVKTSKENVGWASGARR